MTMKHTQEIKQLQKELHELKCQFDELKRENERLNHRVYEAEGILISHGEQLGERNPLPKKKVKVKPLVG